MIIIIEDNPIQRQVLKIVINDGHILMPKTPEEINNITDSLSLETLECILLDRVMPPDWESAAMRLLEKAKGIPVIEWSVSNFEDLYFKRPDVVDSIKKTGTGFEVAEFIKNLRSGCNDKSSWAACLIPFLNLSSR